MFKSMINNSYFKVAVLVSDGITNWSQEAFNTLSASGALQSLTDGGSLVLSLTLQPDTLYSIDILDPVEINNHFISEPPTLLLLLGGLLTPIFGFVRRKSA